MTATEFLAWQSGGFDPSSHAVAMWPDGGVAVGNAVWARIGPANVIPPCFSASDQENSA
ncbi:hypothetical protein [Croceicoccus estronivorus]|uniref:hypothetical protein n=1 Tax=Croceicoccus estronivorus TaxID=1172626 RepID=UPI000B017833|nr:hypothetical protein [Croceicoccus estronivorus]